MTESDTSKFVYLKVVTASVDAEVMQLVYPSVCLAGLKSSTKKRETVIASYQYLKNINRKHSHCNRY